MLIRFMNDDRAGELVTYFSLENKKLNRFCFPFVQGCVFLCVCDVDSKKLYTPLYRVEKK